MNNLKKFLLSVIVGSLILVLTLYLLFVTFYPKAPVMMYGSKQFEGAQVYADNTLVAVMTWDEENNRTYARDIHFINPNIFNALKLSFLKGDTSDQLFKLPSHTGSVTFRIVKTDKSEFINKISGVESVSYNGYIIDEFEEVKR